MLFWCIKGVWPLNGFEKTITIEDLPEPYGQIAQMIGLENTIKLAHDFGGTITYFPKLDSIIKPLRDRKIREEFNGYNHECLAKKYNLTVQWIREIVSVIEKEIKRKPLDGQINLFQE